MLNESYISNHTKDLKMALSYVILNIRKNYELSKKLDSLIYNYGEILNLKDESSYPLWIEDFDKFIKSNNLNRNLVMVYIKAAYEVRNKTNTSNNEKSNKSDKELYLDFYGNKFYNLYLKESYIKQSLNFYISEVGLNYEEALEKAESLADEVFKQESLSDFNKNRSINDNISNLIKLYMNEDSLPYEKAVKKAYKNINRYIKN